MEANSLKSQMLMSFLEINNIQMDLEVNISKVFQIVAFIIYTDKSQIPSLTDNEIFRTKRL